MFRGEVAGVLAKHLKKSKDEIEELLETPPDSSMGDYALPCFFGKNPKETAEKLASEIDIAGNISKVEAKGPYLNFFIKDQAFVEKAFQSPEKGNAKRKVVVEYSSPNIAKPFHIGHLRSTVIGQALKNIYEYRGWNTTGINHLGDWGTQFGNLIAAYRKWPVDLEKDPILNLMEIYVRFTREAEKDNKLAEEGREWFRKLEGGDKEAIELWKKFREISIDEFEKIYCDLGVRFDHYHGESFYEDKMPKVIKELEKKQLLVESDGAWIVNLEEYGMAPMIVVKSDGATTYATRDLAAAIYRNGEFGFDRMLYEVGSEQSLHFKQLFKVLELMGHGWVEDCEHVKHGIYRFNDRKMSTREGDVIFVKDLIEDAKQRVFELIKEKNPDIKNKEEVASMVGTGAIIFNDIKNDRVKDVNFDWEEILNFEGDSGPYLQYTHARIRSVLKKSKEKPMKNASLLKEEMEARMARHLFQFDEALDQVIRGNKPHILARWLLETAQLFNNYYQKHRIIRDDKELERARLALLEAVRERMELGMNLLGLQAPEEM